MPGFHYITRPDERKRCRCIFLPSVPAESVTDCFTWGRTDERNNRIIILMTLRGVKLKELSTECSTNKPDQLYPASLYPRLPPSLLCTLNIINYSVPTFGLFLKCRIICISFIPSVLHSFFYISLGFRVQKRVGLN